MRKFAYICTIIVGDENGCLIQRDVGLLYFVATKTI